MTEKVAVMRLQKDFKRLMLDPVPYVTAAPKPNNFLEWFFVVRGPENTPYDGGFYLGRLIFPSDYPFKPPSIMLVTPNGRFAVNQRLCLSNSDFHPETWNPAWNVGTILCGLVSFMTGDQTTVGSIKTTDLEKRVFARASIAWNLNNPTFRTLFPQFVEELEGKLREATALGEGDKNDASKSKVDPDKVEKANTVAPKKEIQRNGNFFTGKWLRILCVAGLAAFAVAVRAFSHSVSA